MARTGATAKSPLVTVGLGVVPWASTIMRDCGSKANTRSFRNAVAKWKMEALEVYALVVPEAEPPPPVHLVDLPDELLERICAAAACGAPANAGVLPRTLQLTELSEEADVDPCRFSAASFARLAR